MNATHCTICGGDEWTLFSQIYSGKTEYVGQTLIREELEFPLGYCCNCGHVMTLVHYNSKIFSAIYDLENQQPVSFGNSSNVDKMAPYVEMIEFVGGNDLICEEGLIIDVGCGNGMLLQALVERFGIETQRLVGIDFNRMLPKKFNFIKADLNNDDLLEAIGQQIPVAAVMCSHVIEHVIDARRFLRQLKKVAEFGKGKIFIETPDFSAIDASRADVCNLIHPQHINYFTANTLSNLIKSSGFTIEHLDTHVTGNIPRLRVLARPAPTFEPHCQIRC
jgi:2-polyprenyl-3-methyl-5-hydroxy-6-metoxy-1,4-benzoquinol methylase